MSISQLSYTKRAENYTSMLLSEHLFTYKELASNKVLKACNKVMTMKCKCVSSFDKKKGREKILEMGFMKKIFSINFPFLQQHKFRSFADVEHTTGIISIFVVRPLVFHWAAGI